MISIGAPQAIYFVIVIMSVGMDLARHGEPKPVKGQKYNFFTSLTASVIVFGLLYWGGFFTDRCAS